jgi:hypothetical protein
MTKERIREILALLGWGVKDTARILNIDVREFRRNLYGSLQLHDDAAEILEKHAAMALRKQTAERGHGT